MPAALLSGMVSIFPPLRSTRPLPVLTQVSGNPLGYLNSVKLQPGKF